MSSSIDLTATPIPKMGAHLKQVCDARLAETPVLIRLADLNALLKRARGKKKGKGKAILLLAQPTQAIQAEPISVIATGRQVQEEAGESLTGEEQTVPAQIQELVDDWTKPKAFDFSVGQCMMYIEFALLDKPADEIARLMKLSLNEVLLLSRSLDRFALPAIKVDAEHRKYLFDLLDQELPRHGVRP